MIRAAALALALAVLAAPASAATRPSTVAEWRGYLNGVGQGSTTIGWLEQSLTGYRCTVRVRTVPAGAERRYRGGCGPPEKDLVVAGGVVAWGGFGEVRCADTHDIVYVASGRLAREVATIRGSCVGYGDELRGIASNGAAVFYAVVSTQPDGRALDCGNGGACPYRLTGARVYRIDRGRPVAMADVPPAARSRRPTDVSLLWSRQRAGAGMADATRSIGLGPRGTGASRSAARATADS